MSIPQLSQYYGVTITISPVGKTDVQVIVRKGPENLSGNIFSVNDDREMHEWIECASIKFP